MPGKGEIDKEKLFRKIMPTFAPEDALDVSAPAPEDGVAFAQYTAPLAQEPSPPFVAAQEDSAALAQYAAPPVQSTSAEPVAMPEASPPPAAAQETEDDEEVVPINIPELIINRYYDTYVTRFNCCKCAVCRDDSCSIALNRVKPRYVPSDRITEEALTDRDMITETVTALIKALGIVKQNPRH